jgi:sialic acid synthase SpsE
VRGHTLFRSKDRLLLTKSIIDRTFDVDVLATFGVAESIMALHDANRGEKLTVDSLSKVRPSATWSDVT